MNLSTQLHFHNLQKVKNLEIKYKTPSIKCGYLNDWIIYGETVEKAIENLEKLINDLKNYQLQEREFFGDALIKNGKSSARKQ